MGSRKKRQGIGLHSLHAKFSINMLTLKIATQIYTAWECFCKLWSTSPTSGMALDIKVGYSKNWKRSDNR